MARLIVALDVPECATAQKLIETLAPLRPVFKVGYEAYYRYGELLLPWLAARQCDIMLDLKFHDIPRTVAAAIEHLITPSVRILTVHALGGEKMLFAAVDAALARATQLGISPPAIFAVTILTSIAELDLPEIGLGGGVGENVVRLAAIARNAGCTGVVCSPHEVPDLKAFFGRQFEALCPGIRPAGTTPGDQQRLSTPAHAAAAGADYLVVGRPLTQAADPYAAAQAILAEIAGVQIT